MKRSGKFISVIVALATVLAAAVDKKKAPLPAPVSPRSKEVRDRIAFLFPQNAGLPENSALDHDPFRFGYTGTKDELQQQQKAKSKDSAPAPFISEEAAGMPDSEMLKRGVGKIRVGGVFVLNGVAKISVDGSPRKEGDVITVSILGRPVPILIGHLTPKSVIFMLADQGEKGPQVALRF